VVIGEASGADAQPGGFAEQLIQKVDKTGLNDRVVFAGFRDDLPACLKAIDISCIPSTKEAFGLSVIESMAAGCAVIGSGSGAIPELVGEDRGLVADPRDSAEWANAMAELLSDAELRKRLSKAASEWASSRFDLGEHIRMLTGYYRNA
jgi:glycosyltransferase involved in cell wall biosynthesis